MFYQCSSLSYLDISSFQFNSTNSTLFDESLPEKGKIIVDSIFLPIIEGQTPSITPERVYIVLTLYN